MGQDELSARLCRVLFGVFFDFMVCFEQSRKNTSFYLHVCFCKIQRFLMFSSPGNRFLDKEYVVLGIRLFEYVVLGIRLFAVVYA